MVTNAIVLVDLVNQYREKGLSTAEAVMAGGEKRLRPILMTALATILAYPATVWLARRHGAWDPLHDVLAGLAGIAIALVFADSFVAGAGAGGAFP